MRHFSFVFKYFRLISPANPPTHIFFFRPFKNICYPSVLKILLGSCGGRSPASFRELRIDETREKGIVQKMIPQKSGEYDARCFDTYHSHEGKAIGNAFLSYVSKLTPVEESAGHAFPPLIAMIVRSARKLPPPTNLRYLCQTLVSFFWRPPFFFPHSLQPLCFALSKISCHALSIPSLVLPQAFPTASNTDKIGRKGRRHISSRRTGSARRFHTFGRIPGGRGDVRRPPGMQGPEGMYDFG